MLQSGLKPVGISMVTPVDHAESPFRPPSRKSEQQNISAGRHGALEGKNYCNVKTRIRLYAGSGSVDLKYYIYKKP